MTWKNICRPNSERGFLGVYRSQFFTEYRMDTRYSPRDFFLFMVDYILLKSQAIDMFALSRWHSSVSRLEIKKCIKPEQKVTHLSFH